MEMINVVAINQMERLTLLTIPSNIEIDHYLYDNGIYELLRPHISDYFLRDKDGKFSCHYKLNKNASEQMFIKVGKYIANIDFSQLN